MNYTPILIERYAARKGSSFSDKDAEIIGPELGRLCEAGKGKPQDIVAAAKPKKSPLHPYFEWNNTVAGEQYRLWQARSMAGSIQVVIKQADDSLEIQSRAFHSVKVTVDNTDIIDEKVSAPQQTQERARPERTYVTVNMVASDEQKAAQVVRQAREHLMGWYREYNQYRILFQQYESRYDRVLELVEGILKQEPTPIHPTKIA